MPKVCETCGEEIIFRYVRGAVKPLGCRCRRQSEVLKSQNEDATFKTNCPKCGNTQVFFIRHNGGCLWVDALGDPWPKHHCFADNDDCVETFFPGQRINGIGTIRLGSLSDWKRRTVFYAHCTDFSGFLIILSSKGPLPVEGSLVSLSDDRTALFTGEGAKHLVSTDVRRCQHCDEAYLWAEYTEHTNFCLNKDYTICPICQERVHWTQYTMHRKHHRIT
jgi:hypothetical protein